MDLTERRVRLSIADRLDSAAVARLTEALLAPGRIITLEGSDGRFCDGLDLADAETVDLEPFARLLSALDATPRPVVALVDGPALGGGCALAATADLVLATPRATFGLPEVLWGLIPAVAFPQVARRVGVARARLLALGIPALDAAEAHRWGLVDAVVDDLEAALAVHARRLLRADPDAQGVAKALPSFLGPEYASNARKQFHDLAASAPTRARLAKLGTDDLPWSTEP